MTTEAHASALLESLHNNKNLVIDETAAEERKIKGNGLFAKGQFEDALLEYQEAIKLNPTSAVFFSNAAACSLKLNNPGQAVLFAEEAIRLDPSMAKAYFRRADALMAMQQWRDALVDLLRVESSTEKDKVVLPEVHARIKTCRAELQKIAFAKAIHVEVFQLTPKAIKALTIPEAYVGPQLMDDEPITMSFVKQLVEHFRAERRLPAKFLYRILMDAKQLLTACPSLVSVSTPSSAANDGKLTICGDVHGQFFDLAHLLDINGYPSESHTYLFNGDIVDRGPASIEVALLLLALKVAFPANFFIARGNHESESVNRMHGFYEEISRKYNGDQRMFPLFNQVLHALPLAHVVDQKYFVVHGGLPSNAKSITLDEIRQIERFQIPTSGSVMSQLLWSDPQDAPGMAASHRGEGILFGPDITEAFLTNNHLERIIRSHVWVNEGYLEQHDGKCVTIFSAPNYTGSISPGAVINLDQQGNWLYKQFDAAPMQGTAYIKARAANFNAMF